MLAGAVVGVTFSPHGGPATAFLAFAPLGARLAGTRAPFRDGFLAAAAAHGVGLHWMVPALAWRTSWALLVYALVLILIGVVGGAAVRVAVALHRAKRWPLGLALGVCWTAFEWSLAHLPGASYSWLNAGASLVWHPAAAGVAEALGARALTLWTVATGACVGVEARRWRTSRGSQASGPGRRPARRSARAALRGRAGRWAAFGALAAAPWAAGEARRRALEPSDRVVAVAAVQAGHGPAGRAAGAIGAAIESWRSALAPDGRPASHDAVVFPERFVAAPLRAASDGALTDAGRAVSSFARRLGAPVIVGGLDARVAPEPRRRGAPARSDTSWYNAAFLFGSDGEPAGVRRKRRLVPGIEGSGWWLARLLGARPGRGYAPGRASSPLPLNGGRVGVLICYDSAYGEVARRLVRDGADWLVVISNDDWLDPDAPFRTTWAYWQHATQSRLRAVENRVGLVQVAATGYTFAVSALGEGPEFALEPGAAGVASVSVAAAGSPTLFTRMGDALGWACFVVFACGLLLGSGDSAPFRRRRRADLPVGASSG